MALTDLPLASGQRHKEVFVKLGWTVQSDGNHIVLTHPNHPLVYLAIPNHDEVKKQTLKSIIRNAGISDQEYAYFFRGGRPSRVTVTVVEDSFRETLEGSMVRVHCVTCWQEVCFSDDATTRDTAKQEHATVCSGEPR